MHYRDLQPGDLFVCRSHPEGACLSGELVLAIVPDNNDLCYIFITFIQLWGDAIYTKNIYTFREENDVELDEGSFLIVRA